MSENVGDILDIFSWDKTNTALADLQELLKCHSCHKIAEDPQCLGRCDHFFCNGCVSSLTNNTCPTCRIPSIPTEKKPDRIISGLISSAKDLAHLLSGGHLEIAQPGHEAPVFDATKNEKNIPPPALYDVVKTNKRKASMIPKHPKGKSEKNAENRRNSTKGKVPVVQKKGSALPKKAGSVGNLSVLSSASNKLANVEEKKVQVKGVKKEKELKEKEEKKKEEKKKEEKRKEEKEKEEKKEEKRNEDKENVEKEKEKCGEEAGSSGETGLTKNFFTPNSKKNVSLPDLSLLGLSPTAVGINKRNAKGETSLHVACIKDEVAEPQDILVVGDSMVRSFDDILQRKTKRRCSLVCHPGSGLTEGTQAIRERRQMNTAMTVVHTGSNDVGRIRSEELMHKYETLLEELKNRGGRHIVCGLLPRHSAGPVWNSRAIGMNERISQLCIQLGVRFFDPWCVFAERRDYYAPCGNRLNHKGKGVFTDLLKEVLAEPDTFLE